jgi:hypothetical protein
MTHSNTSASNQAIKTEVNSSIFFESILETQDDAIKQEVKQATKAAFDKVRKTWGLKYATDRFNNQAEGQEKCQQLIAAIVKEQLPETSEEKTKAEEQKEYGPPIGVKNSFSGILSELLKSKNAQIVEYVGGKFKDMLLDGLAKCDNVQEKYDYLRSA